MFSIIYAFCFHDINIFKLGICNMFAGLDRYLNMFSYAEAIVFLLCCCAYLYSVYFCVDKYLADNSVTDLG